MNGSLEKSLKALDNAWVLSEMKSPELAIIFGLIYFVKGEIGKAREWLENGFNLVEDKAEFIEEISK